MYLSCTLFGGEVTICLMSIFSLDSLRKIRRVWIHLSADSWGMFRSGSESIGVDVPAIFCAHFSCMRRAFPRGVFLRTFCISERIWREPCSANKWRSPTPPELWLAKTTSLGVFLWNPRRGSMARIIFDWAFSACLRESVPDCSP